MISLNGSRCYRRSILLIACLLVAGAHSIWQENVRPKLYVELGEYIKLDLFHFRFNISRHQAVVFFYLDIIYKIQIHTDLKCNSSVSFFPSSYFSLSNKSYEVCEYLYRMPSLTFRSSGKITEIE